MKNKIVLVILLLLIGGAIQYIAALGRRQGMLFRDPPVAAAKSAAPTTEAGRGAGQSAGD